jgi:hypothetical protein
MAEHQLPLIPSPFAEAARSELLSALQAADNPTAWMTFMASVTRLMPDVLSAGRPSSASIQASPIGQLGFKSWQAMIEAPTDANGLGWNLHTWRAWRRAWATVQEHPWLLEQAYTYSEITTIFNEFKPFPGSQEELQALRQAKATSAEQKRTTTLTEALKAAQEAQAAASTLRDQLAEAASRERTLAEEVGSLKRQLELAVIEIELLRVNAHDGSSTSAPLKRNWWSRLLRFFGLGA